SRRRPVGGQDKQLSEAEQKKLWADLGSADAGRGYRAVGALTRSPKHAVLLLRGRLPQLPRDDPERMAELIADLGSERFTTRQKAVKELEKAGELAEPALRKALAGELPLEVRRRLTK